MLIVNLTLLIVKIVMLILVIAVYAFALIVVLLLLVSLNNYLRRKGVQRNYLTIQQSLALLVCTALLVVPVTVLLMM